MLVAGFQGVSTSQGRHDARPRRLGHDRRRARRRDGRRGVRDLHRRRRRLQRRPADRPRRPQAARRLLRGDARDGRVGRRRAAAARGRVRAQPRRAHPLPLLVQRGPRYLCRRRGRDHGTPADHRRHPLDRRGSRHAPRRPGPARRRRAHLHRARRGQRQRRHDHPERARVRGRRGRHVLHRPARRPAEPPARRSTRWSPTSGSSASPRTRRWGRCRSSARE